jgi:N-acyl homoserine lactone hydrolase
MTDDPALSRASMEAIWRRWRARPGTLLIPGHDLPMQLDAAGAPEYVGTRTAAINVWFGEGLEQTTRLELVA